MPTSGLRLVREETFNNLNAAMIVDPNDVHPSLLMQSAAVVDENGHHLVMAPHGDSVVVEKPGKTYVNLDSKHWQGGTTTVLEERTLPVVFQDMKQEDVMPDFQATRRASTRPGRKGARQQMEEEDQSPEEQERIRIRRERNKEAAARCRKRKIDQIESLEKQVSDWESKNEELQKELVNLKHERDELQYLLQQHRTTCTNAVSTASSYEDQMTILRVPHLPAPTTTATATNSTTASDNNSHLYEVKSESGNSNHSDDSSVYSIPEEFRSGAAAAAPEPISIGAPCEEVAAPLPADFTVAKRTRVSRPVSLNLAVRPQNLRSIEGVPIETPTNVFSSLNFDSLMEGRTGLTPTNILTPVAITMGTLTTPVLNSPTCSSQQRNNVTSHNDKNLKLVSL